MLVGSLPLKHRKHLNTNCTKLWLQKENVWRILSIIKKRPQGAEQPTFPVSPEDLVALVTDRKYIWLAMGYQLQCPEETIRKIVKSLVGHGLSAAVSVMLHHTSSVRICGTRLSKGPSRWGEGLFETHKKSPPDTPASAWHHTTHPICQGKGFLKLAQNKKTAITT